MAEEGRRGRGQRWVEIALMPIVVALVGALVTFTIAKYQTDTANRQAVYQADSEERIASAQIESARVAQEIKVLEIFSEKIMSEDERIQKQALMMLRIVNADLAEKLAMAVADDPDQAEAVRMLAEAEISRRLDVSVSNKPDTVAPSEATILTILVRSGEGEPIPGASVEISSGGGKFMAVGESFNPDARLHGPYSYSGLTDDGGTYRVRWVCNPCASGYGLVVTASADDFVSSSVEHTINVDHGF